MNFDFDNLDKYVNAAPSADTLAMIDKVDKTIGERKLSSYDSRFISNIKKRILAEKPLTDKQKLYLAKVLAACRDNTYVIKDYRGGYNKRKAANDDLNITF